MLRLFYRCNKLGVRHYQPSAAAFRKFPIMSLSPKLGDVRPRPEASNDELIAKKPRIEKVDAPKAGKKKEGRTFRKNQKAKKALPEPCSADDVMWKDVVALLGKDTIDAAMEGGSEFDSPFEFLEEVELDIVSLCPNGKSITPFHDLSPKVRCLVASYDSK